MAKPASLIRACVEVHNLRTGEVRAYRDRSPREAVLTAHAESDSGLSGPDLREPGRLERYAGLLRLRATCVNCGPWSASL